GSTFGMSVLTAISAMGGILTPQIVGGAADRVGIVAAISILAVNVVLVILLSAVNRRLYHK
ncbi:MAG: MFS transporter, partial [Hungatella hathewayi]|nr:MFS transporter [Hungatella hathewayi]